MNPLPQADGAWEPATAAVAGAFVGWLVTLAVGRLGESRDGSRGLASRAAVVAAFAVGAAGLWWWEAIACGQLPAAAGGVPRVALAWRWAGHVVLGGFLAAAAWIDLRDRVIPDSITVPGALAGLAWAGLIPGSLPPISRIVPRSFAVPTEVPDVLGLAGPLGGATLPGWLGEAPATGGLAVATALFVAWWLGCTAWAEAGADGRRPFDPRLPLLATGLVGIGACWWHGGPHWIALLSALVGLATGVAVLWAIRIGASRALGREALGFGDVTLVAVIGAWLGWQGAVLACCLGVLAGLAHGLVQVARSRDNELPFGPSLCVGALLVVVFWRPLWDRFAPVFERPGEVAAVAGAVIVLTGLTLAAWRRPRERPGA